MIFSAETPASNASELVEYLESEHRQGDLYRGQIRDYPALVPSIYRKLMVDGTQFDAFPLIREGASIDPTAEHNQPRWQFARHLHKCFGLAIGNILSQQYGLSSETLDVSGDPSIAAYFANRSYPNFQTLTGSSEMGVIYRIREKIQSYYPPKLFKELPLSSLDFYFQEGVCDGILFEEFLTEQEAESSREINRWVGGGKIVEVGTRSLTLSCEQILEIVRLERDRQGEPKRMAYNPTSRRMYEQIIESDWLSSRLVKQNGGLIRPQIFFDALVDPNFKVAYRRSDFARIRGHRSFVDLGFLDDQVFLPPRAVPGLAIKKSLKRIENLKHRDGVESFYFRQGSETVSVHYRSTLWPEPDEDEVYAAIWQRLVAHKIITGEDPDVAVDDPDAGYLDPGYRVDGSYVSAATDRGEALYTGILQDSEEGLKADPTNIFHMQHLAFAKIRLGHSKAIVSTILELHRRQADTFFSHYALYHIFWQLGKKRWAKKNFSALERIRPNDSRTHFLRAIDFAQNGNLHRADGELNLAISKLTAQDIGLRSSDLVSLQENLRNVAEETLGR